MTFPRPGEIFAAHSDGDVVLRMDPNTARELAEAWAGVQVLTADLVGTRPGWASDIVAIHRSAAFADIQRGVITPDVAYVPRLRLVAGGDPS